jgi:sulfur carrier protein ThiS
MSGNGPPRSMILNLQRESSKMEVEVKDSQSFIEVLSSAGLSVDGVLIFYKGVPIPLDTMVKDHGEVTVINVASGG